MEVRTYEITFLGEAGPALCAAFDDFDLTIGCGVTTLRGMSLDQSALHGVIQRVGGLGLELLEVRTVTPPPGAATT